VPSHPDIYISTQTGLFRGSLNGRIDDLQPIGDRDLGLVRAPIAIDYHNPDRLYLGTRRGGMFRSDDRGKTWHEKNDGLIYKEVWCIVQHPATGEVFVGTGPASVFKSSDYGDSWTFCEHLHTMKETIDWTFPNPPHVAHVKSIGLSRKDPKMIYGAIEEGWLIRSKDGGDTWETLKSGTTIDSHTVSVMPDNPNVLLSASGNGIFRSEDGGDNFILSSDGLTREYVSQIAFHESEPEILFTASAEVPPGMWRRPQGANSKFFRSNDQGRSWNELSGGLPDHMSAAPRAATGHPDRAGSFLVGMNDGSIWMTANYGESFDQVANGLPPVYGIAISRN
jgi:photosystem II stability/assembly factor-like uncharacterized protein